MPYPQLHVVLDHNFPYQVVYGLDWPPYIRLSGLKDAAPHLVNEPDDWRTLLALGALSGIDGYVTNGAEMLQLAPEMVTLTRTNLTLVVTSAVGHNPLPASGLLMTYLPEIGKRMLARTTRRSTVFRLRAARVGQSQTSPGRRLDDRAMRRNIPPQRLIAETLRALGLR